MKLADYIALSVKQNASDLHLSSGYLPTIRQNGCLIALSEHKLVAAELDEALKSSLSAQQRQILTEFGQVDYALTIGERVRLRGNLFQQRHGLSAVYRFIPTGIPSLADLMVPEVLAAQVMQRNGLLLVTGATGSGKSTTLAALVQHLNQIERRHIITLEDPIEFLHCSQNCLIQQREIGLHTDSFANGLRGALRQDPDVILIGELRDPETIRLALTAAETGHLVLSSLHTRSALQCVERMLDVFPLEEKVFVRAQLAASLRTVLAQQLLPKTGGGRIAAYELLLNTAAVANLIRAGKTHQLASILQTGAGSGMQTMEQGIARRRAEGYFVAD